MFYKTFKFFTTNSKSFIVLKYIVRMHNILGVIQDLGKDGYKPETVTKATTTALVRHVFESYFDSYLSRRAGTGGSASTGFQMTGVASQMCGVCKGCQQKDCGHCDSCESMIKFGGKEDGLICDRRCCLKNTSQQQQMEQKLKSASASALVEKQRRKNKNEASKVKWLDPLPLMNQENTKPNMKYYSKVGTIRCPPKLFLSSTI